MSVQSLKNSNSSGNAWNQLGQLLTCAICLDRYRNPKLLPCQHTFCMEPCMEGLVDYVRHQVKCPECRAEHRIPYQGIQGFPTSVTLMRFLELHCEVTGEVPDPPSAMMVRCGVCTEKSYVGPCAHCEKKVCSECKEAHLDIMKREIARINGQVRRGLNRLQDALSQVVKSSQQVTANCSNIVVEIEEVYRRLGKELKDREATLKAEVATFMQNELKMAESLKEGLQLEVANIESNAELVEKHVSEKNDWDDVELMEYKDTFLRTLEFLRNFDPDQADFNRRLKFQIGPEPETTYHSLANLGELIISAPNFPGSCVTSTVGVANATSGGTGGLMRSKSEHRLASSASTAALSTSQSQRHENYLSIMQRAGHGNSDTEGREGRNSPLTRRRTGELADGTSIRRGRDMEDNDRSTYASRRYGREYGSTSDARTGYKHGGEDDYGGYRSRFGSRDGSELQRDSSDGDLTSSRSVRFASRHQEAQQNVQEVVVLRERVLETEDATRGPLSGIIRLMDSPRVMERLHQHGQKLKQQQKEAKVLQAQALTAIHHAPVMPTPAARQRTARQVSEDDEIAKQKAANKTQAAQGATAAAAKSPPPPTPVVAPTPPPPAAVTSPTRPTSRRAVQREESLRSTASNDERSESDSQSSPRRKEVEKKPASRQASRDVAETAPVADTVRPPSRQTSTESTSALHDRSAASSESSVKEDESISKKRFYNRPTVETKLPAKPAAPASASITETADDSDSDSEPETKTPQPQTGANAATLLGHQITLDDITGVEKPNYFRYRSATSYSRTPSNSSLNLNSPDSPDESGRVGALSPTRPLSPPFTSRPKPTAVTETNKAKDRANSTDSSESSSSESATNVPSSRTVNSTVAAATPSSPPVTTVDKKSDVRYAPFRSRENGEVAATKDNANSSIPSGRLSSLGQSGRTSSLDKRDETSAKTEAKPRFVSRFLPRKEDTDSDSDSDVDSRPTAGRKAKEEDNNPSPITALLARSANARRDNHTANSNSNAPTAGRTEGSHYGSGNATNARSSYAREQQKADDSSRQRTAAGAGSSSYNHTGRDEYKKDDPSEGRYSSLASKYLTRSRPSLCDVDDKDDTKYVSYGSRYLSKSKSTAALSFEKDDMDDGLSSSLSRRSSIVGGGTERYRKDSISGAASRYSASRRSRLGRSKSSHDLNGGEDDDDDDDNTNYGGGGTTYRSATTTAAAAAASSSSSQFERPSDYLASKRLQSREQSPDETAAGSSSLSSWARYLKTKYGNKSSKEKSDYQPIGRSRSSHALYSREASSESSEEETESNLMHDSTKKDSTVSYSPGYGGLNSGRTGSSDNTRSAYQQKRKVMMKIGARGSEQGRFTWPRGIAVGPDNSIVVADSSNHRVQIFDAQGSFCKEFGTYGNAEGEFDCLAGVAVNRIGQYIISDRYNHRIQIFDPSGRFLRTFGSQGSVDGKLSYPWGIATDSLGFIYVCDKENHRVQVFQSDGTFVGKFGSLGNKAGQLEHPHYIAVSNTNKVVVSDSNNHRIQIFDVNGRVLSTFGSEGADEGQFKFPRGVAVDDQGYIIVGDSGNNRIQVFLPDGTFLKSFGAWGSGDGEFKGLEGVAVTSSGGILVCDRENHRIQIF